MRSRPQRNAYHRFTVDRHLCEAAANAAALADRVDRPDLLVVGALLHDIGKGYPRRPHRGRHRARPSDRPAAWASIRRTPRCSSTMVRHHLLLPDVATRRDLDDDATITAVADAVGSIGTLQAAGRAHRGRLAGHRAGGVGRLEGRLVATRGQDGWTSSRGDRCGDIVHPTFPTLST